MAEALAERATLAGIFRRLHSRFGPRFLRHSARKKGKVKRKRAGAAQALRLEELYLRTRGLRLLELAKGRWISADVAARERPRELASLELWKGLSAEQLVHQRKSDRESADRKRALRLQREREQERARDRARPRPRPHKKKKSEAARPRLVRASGGAEGSATERLLEALRSELGMVRASREGLLSWAQLGSLVPDSQAPSKALFHHSGAKVRVNMAHPIAVRALAAGPEDRITLSLLSSAAYSFLNIIHSEIEDEDEFLRLHATYVASALQDKS